MVKAKSFSYDTTAVSEKQFDEHLALYRGYADKINEIDEKLKEQKQPVVSNAVYSLYRGLKKGETFALCGVILHELYFQNMTAHPAAPGPAALAMFHRYFGGFDNWSDDFANCAKSARGWAVLVYDQRSDTFRNILQDAHDDGDVMLAFPLLVLDMYEHAYFLDYGKNKDQYIQAFMKSICWKTVGLRMGILGKYE